MSRATTTTFPEHDDEHEGEGEGEGEGGPRVIPFQPRPIRLSVCNLTDAAGTTTAIMRTWAPGDAARCRLCPSHECTADAGDVCLVQVRSYISDRSAATFSVTAWRARQGVAAGRVDLAPDADAGT